MPTDLPYWGYADPGLDAVDAVRYYIGDTDPDDPQLADNEIAFSLDNNGGDPLKAAIEAAIVLAGRFARESTYRIGQVSETNSRKSEAYERLAKLLAERLVAGGGGSGPYAGGISVADKAEEAGDADRTAGIFSVGMMDND